MLEFNKGLTKLLWKKIPIAEVRMVRGGYECRTIQGRVYLGKSVMDAIRPCHGICWQSVLGRTSEAATMNHMRMVPKKEKVHHRRFGNI